MILKFTAIAFILLTLPIILSAQAQSKTAPVSAANEFKASPAYAELRLRKAELESELEAMLLEYTEEFPKVMEIRISLGLLAKESERLQTAGLRGTQRLTLALGKLMVRKVELETDLSRLLENLQPGHPDVKRAKRKVEIYESAIKDILGQ
ncbi:MAG: hypothetical protein HOP17_08650 [Acidobacteria bacterium]|nr:hypothetical protein [Acidobacteriota bacterium]